MTSQQPELIARRGLTLPEPTLTRLRTVGIWFDANLTVTCPWRIRHRNPGHLASQRRVSDAAVLHQADWGRRPQFGGYEDPWNR